jgi:hypothetical protein
LKNDLSKTKNEGKIKNDLEFEKRNNRYKNISKERNNSNSNNRSVNNVSRNTENILDRTSNSKIPPAYSYHNNINVLTNNSNINLGTGDNSNKSKNQNNSNKNNISKEDMAYKTYLLNNKIKNKSSIDEKLKIYENNYNQIKKNNSKSRSNSNISKNN